MLDVAGAEPNVIPPTKKGEDSQKDFIGRLALEYRPVPQLVAGGTSEKPSHRSVGKECGEQERDRPDPCGGRHVEKRKVGQGPGGYAKSQVPESLTITLEVAALQQFRHDFFVNVRTVPLDLGVCSKCRGGFHTPARNPSTA